MQIIINNVVHIQLFKFNFNKRIIIMNYFLGSTHYSRTFDRVNNRGLLSFVTVVRNDLQLNFDYQNMQIITDFEQGQEMI